MDCQCIANNYGIELLRSYHKKMRLFVKIIHITTKCYFTSTVTTGKIPSTHITKSPNSSTPALCAEVAALCRKGLPKEALAIVYLMDQRGVPVNDDTYASLLQACSHTKALAEGKEVHAHMRRNGLNEKVNLQTKLVSMYAVCGSLVDARHTFDKMRKRNVSLWNAMIRGYANNGLSDEALAIFGQMQRTDVQLDHHTFPCVLKACAGLSALQRGKEIHDYIVKRGFESDVFVGNALVAMYAKCSSVDSARHVFDKMPQRDAVSWNSMIAGYTQNGYCNEALELFRQMELADMKPNSVTIASILPAYASLGNLVQCKEIHEYIRRSGFESDVFVGSTLIDMYAKCKNVETSRRVFDRMSERDIVSWNAMIAGYAQNGHCDEALKLFREMQVGGIQPSSSTIASLLQACAHLTALQQGKEMHDYIIRRGFESNDFVASALINMYAKCGNIDIARHVFDKMSHRDVVSWTAMIMGYAMHGFGENALALFHQMQQACMKPNYITLIAVLTACSHAGMLDEAWQHFHCMSQDYLIEPTAEHYACMVDLLGRAGHLDDAYHFIQNMPLEPDAGVWGSLLGACRVHCNIEIGVVAAEHIFELEPNNSGYYVVMSNIYAAAGRWDGVAKLRAMMKERGLKKKPAYSWIEVKNTVHAFHAEDRSHPQSENIYATLESLAEQMKATGYVPTTECLLHDLQED
eukprot:Gb_09382 [translate_table: standard]